MNKGTKEYSVFLFKCKRRFCSDLHSIVANGSLPSNGFEFFQTLSTIVTTEKRDRTYSYLDLIRTPEMRKLALRTGILWSAFPGLYSVLNLVYKL